MKVLKDLNNGQLAVCDVADKLRIQKSLLAKQTKERKTYHKLCCWRNKKETSKGMSKYEIPCIVCETLLTICESKKP